jgi:hypothetical protein
MAEHVIEKRTARKVLTIGVFVLSIPVVNKDLASLA